MSDKYGPNTPVVEAHVKICAGLTVEQAHSMILAWDVTPGDLWLGAQNVAWLAARRVSRQDAWNATVHALDDALHQAAWNATVHGATRAALDVATALVVRDRIRVETFETLAAPWASVMGRTWDE